MVWDVPDGHVVAVVTDLEMVAPFPDLGPVAAMTHLPDIDPAHYLALWRRVGTPWLWMSRAQMTPERLAQVLAERGREVWVLEGEAGLVELYMEGGTCEIAFFGLVPGAEGRGLGRAAMAAALARAGQAGMSLAKVSTCTFDSPAAMPFYLRCGFRATWREVHVSPDPRLSGDLPMDAAPHVPLIAEG